METDTNHAGKSGVGSSLLVPDVFRFAFRLGDAVEAGRRGDRTALVSADTVSAEVSQEEALYGNTGFGSLPPFGRWVAGSVKAPELGGFPCTRSREAQTPQQAVQPGLGVPRAALPCCVSWTYRRQFPWVPPNSPTPNRGAPGIPSPRGLWLCLQSRGDVIRVEGYSEPILQP